MITTKLSKEVLTALILGYEERMTKMGAELLPIEFLTGENGALGLKSLCNQIAAPREPLEAKLAVYENRVCNIDFPGLDSFAFEFAGEKVSEAHGKYKAAMIEKGAEYVFENAYYIDIANQLDAFFQNVNKDSFCDDDSMSNVLDCSLRDGFFDQLLAYASGQSEFDITTLETAGDEIADYCVKKMAELMGEHAGGF